MEKKCFKCGAVKELAEFYRHPQMKDGHLNKCKECTKIDVFTNYRRNRQHYAEYERERSKRPKRKGRALEYQRKRRSENPMKYRANTKLGNAKRSEEIVQGECEICGAPNTEGHHDDYEKPLDVRWLCRKHHLQKHGKMAYG